MALSFVAVVIFLQCSLPVFKERTRKEIEVLGPTPFWATNKISGKSKSFMRGYCGTIIICK